MFNYFFFWGGGEWYDYIICWIIKEKFSEGGEKPYDGLKKEFVTCRGENEVSSRHLQ